MEAGDRNWLRTTYLVSGTQIAVLIGFGIAMPFLPLFLQRELGLTDRGELAIWTGVIAGAAGLPMAFFAPIWGPSAIATAARRCSCAPSPAARSCSRSWAWSRMSGNCSRCASCRASSPGPRPPPRRSSRRSRRANEAASRSAW